MAAPETYSESAEGIIISRDRAIVELKSHGVPEDGIEEFLSDCGDKPQYAATEVLTWLGY